MIKNKLFYKRNRDIDRQINLYIVLIHTGRLYRYIEGIKFGIFTLSYLYMDIEIDMQI